MTGKVSLVGTRENPYNNIYHSGALLHPTLRIADRIPSFNVSNPSKSRPLAAAAEKQFAVGNEISERAQREIQEIINELSMGRDPDKPEEVERIREVCDKGEMKKLRTVKVDLFVRSFDGAVHLFDLKTAKPNVSNFKDFKRTLLEWVAIFLAKEPEADVSSYIAIPYNPYAPKPYERWTIKGMLDLENELKVAEELWDFLGGGEVYSELLDCFEKTGMELKPEIDQRNSNKFTLWISEKLDFLELLLLFCRSERITNLVIPCVKISFGETGATCNLHICPRYHFSERTVQRSNSLVVPYCVYRNKFQFP